MKTSFKTLALVAIVLAFCISCAGMQNLQDQYNKLSNEEKARFIVDQAQTQLEVALNTALALEPASGPDYTEALNTKILPAISHANRMLGEIINTLEASSGEIDPAAIQLSVIKATAEALQILQTFGVIKESEVRS